MKRIKYVSRYSKPLTSEEIASLAEKAAAKNAKLDVSGVLMTAGGLFFQVIEGPEEHVERLYREICKDKRHMHVLLLAVEEGVRSRLFPDWSMKRVDLDESSGRLEPVKAILTAVVRQRMLTEELTGVLERAVWTEFTKAGQS